jgi:uncharacterized membrane protein YphA (DoxX/SURF4 family)
MPAIDRVKTIALWTASGLLALLYLFSGAMKFLSPDAVEGFAKMGYPDWFRVLIGLGEIGGGLLLLVPRLAALGAAGLAIIMAGAAYTHFKAGEVPQGFIPLVLLVVLVLIAYARWPRLTGRAI